MITVDGKWVMEGLNRDDKKRIKSHKELCQQYCPCRVDILLKERLRNAES